jgi:tetratricopeptide (TPR) repeat protein
MSETMSIHRRESPSSFKETVMRYAPVALVLSALAALTASAGQSAVPEVLDPRAAALEAQGKAALASGDLDRATDGFEAALAISPGSAVLVMDLADVARHQAMPGKALHYYRAVLAAIRPIWRRSGEGQALAQKGASTRPSAIWPGWRRSAAMAARPRAVWLRSSPRHRLRGSGQCDPCGGACRQRGRRVRVW